MTREEKLAVVSRAFAQANRQFTNPGKQGRSVRGYATFVASEIRRFLADGPPPTQFARADALELADDLERGEFDHELAAMFGYM